MYKTKDIIEKSIEVIKEQNLIFIGDILLIRCFLKMLFMITNAMKTKR